MNNKDVNLKERLKQALSSTIRVISNDLEEIENSEKDKGQDKSYNFEIDNLSSKKDFIKARAEADSAALKKKIFK